MTHVSGGITALRFVTGLGTPGVRAADLRLAATCTAFSAAYAGAVGYSRVNLHRHHVSDVIGGYVLAVLWPGLGVAHAADRRT
jgi:membrane-associated phospholipid phosphatase